MKAIVKKWGNSAALRIPVVLLQSLKLDLESEVDVREENGRLIIEPLLAKTYELKDLLAGVSKNNLHSVIEMGESVGGEIW